MAGFGAKRCNSAEDGSENRRKASPKIRGGNRRRERQFIPSPEGIVCLTLFSDFLISLMIEGNCKTHTKVQSVAY